MINKSPPKRIILPNWYLASSALILGLYLGFTFLYWSGAKGISLNHSSGISFNRQWDGQLYQIDKNTAFYIQRGVLNPSVSIVHFKKQLQPLALLCGQYQLDGSVLNNANFLKGTYIYTGYPYFAGNDVYDLVTGNSYALTGLVTPELGQSLQADEVPFYKEHGLNFNPENELTVDKIKQRFSALPLCQESCISWNLAFLLIIALWLIILPVVWIIQRRKHETGNTNI